MSLDSFIHRVTRIEMRPRAYSRPNQDSMTWLDLVIDHRTLGDDGKWRSEQVTITCFTDSPTREFRQTLLYELPVLTDTVEPDDGEPIDANLEG